MLEKKVSLLAVALFEFIALTYTMPVLSAHHASLSPLKTEYIQSIQVVNLLANTDLTDPGMTPTPIVVTYFNRVAHPCWMATLHYQEDYTIHAGPTQGCIEKVDRVEIAPMLVANKLKTYQPPIFINIDTTKYSNQITIIQDQPPQFNSSNGMVTKSGTLQAKIQAQFN